MLAHLCWEGFPHHRERGTGVKCRQEQNLPGFTALPALNKPLNSPRLCLLIPQIGNNISLLSVSSSKPLYSLPQRCCLPINQCISTPTPGKRWILRG